MLFMHFSVCQKFEHSFTHHSSRVNAFFSIGRPLITSLDAANKVIREIFCLKLHTFINMACCYCMTGGTVLKLGTERHHSKLLKGIDTLEDVGCFGLTELGYGML